MHIDGIGIIQCTEPIEFLRIEPDLARHVRPRRAFGQGLKTTATAEEIRQLESIDDLSRLVADIERDHKGVPVLLRQYLKCGGRLLGFSSDERFAGVLDGLIMADLRKADPRILARYMGEEGAAAFLAHHAGAATGSPQSRQRRRWIWPRILSTRPR